MKNRRKFVTRLKIEYPLGRKDNYSKKILALQFGETFTDRKQWNQIKLKLQMQNILNKTSKR